MSEQAHFDVERGEALVPWPVHRFPLWPAYAFSALLWTPVIIGAIASNWGPLNIFFVSFVMLFALPWLVTQHFIRLTKPGDPLAIGPEEMVCSSVGGGSGYVRWSEVATVALVRSMLGRGMAPIGLNLLIHKRAGGMMRLSVPPMSVEEFDQFWAVLETISGRHQITLLTDATEDGERRIRRLPLF